MFIDLASCTSPPPAAELRQDAAHRAAALPERCIRQLLAAAWAAFPEEACGALLGEPGGDPRDRRVLAAVAVRNQALCDRTRTFAMDPAAVQRARRAAGLDVLGFFHSHPEGVARPSAADLRHASPWPGYLHAIVSVSRFGPPEIRLFDAQGDVWRELLRWR
jgi:proteasome lid subunit RPN8/RPN11